jgi:hypothetical protein
MESMAYLILSIIVVIIFAPFVMPWGKKLIAYSITSWFLLWCMFFIQINRESDPVYDAGIISDGVVVGLSIIIFIAVIAIRCLFKFITCKRNHT